MLTPKQIEEARQKFGITPVSKNETPDVAGGLAAAWEQADAEAKPFNSPLERIKNGQAKDNVKVAKGAGKQIAKDVFSTGAQNAGPVGEKMMADAKKRGGGAKKFADAIDAGTDAVEPKGPLEKEGARGTMILEAVAPVPPIAKAARGTKIAEDLVTGVKAVKAAKNSEKALQATIDAVNPDLTGKKLAGAYKEIVTGSRTAQKAGFVTEQSLSPGQQAINTATRLNKAGITLTGKPVDDLATLGTHLKDTETKLTAALKGKDPSVVYNADKPTLKTALAEAKKMTPREFGAIKEQKAVYDNVIDFANELVDKTDDSIEGIRDARSAFDARARIEYPNAFKDGAVDTKTPAGRAIKIARDTMNEHLYNTAPEGSEIRALIQKEADIFRAADNIAPKAAKGDDLTKVEQYLKAFKEHPYITTGGAALATYGGFKFITGN